MIAVTVGLRNEEFKSQVPAKAAFVPELRGEFWVHLKSKIQPQKPPLAFLARSKGGPGVASFNNSLLGASGR